jgi:hypothetical protein
LRRVWAVWWAWLCAARLDDQRPHNCLCLELPSLRSLERGFESLP